MIIFDELCECVYFPATLNCLLLYFLALTRMNLRGSIFSFATRACFSRRRNCIVLVFASEIIFSKSTTSILIRTWAVRLSALPERPRPMIRTLFRTMPFVIITSLTNSSSGMALCRIRARAIPLYNQNERFSGESHGTRTESMER